MLSLGQDFGHVIIVNEPVHHVGALFGGDQDVDIADRFGSAAEAPGDGDLLDALGLLEVIEERRHDLFRDGQLEPFRASFGDLGPAELFEERLLGFGAEARELVDLARLRRLSSDPRARRP